MSLLDPLARQLALLTRAGYPIIYVVSHEEERAEAIVRRAATGTKQKVIRWTASRGFDEEEGELDAEEAIQRLDAEDEPALVLMLDLHQRLNDPRVSRRLRDRFEGFVARQQTLVVVAPVLALPAELEKDVAVIDLPLPKTEEMNQVLSQVAAQEGLEVSAGDAAVRAALGLTAKEARRIFRKVLVQRKGLETSDLGLVVEEKKNALRTTDSLEFHELGPSLGDVGGLDALKRWLGERSRAFGPDARAFGLPAPKGLLLLGVQGCGKSLSAKAVAELWKFPLLRLDLSAVFSGASPPEAAIRQGIKVSESLAPVVLWVDEIEKGFAQVDADDSGSRVFGSFLTWLAEKTSEVFVVATANEVRGLPPELLRRGRFDEVFFVDLPNPKERLQILQIHLERRGRRPEDYAGLEGLARRAEHLSGAELEQVVVAGLYRAFAAKRELSDEDLDIGLQQTVPLYATYEEKIKALRDWAKTRARPATQDASVLDLFERTGEA
ncbi:MAG: AAA family ATPase [Myxococcota bacterium]